MKPDLWRIVMIGAGVGAAGVAIGAAGLWAAGDPPDTGRTLSLISGLICVVLLSSNLTRR